MDSEGRGSFDAVFARISGYGADMLRMHQSGMASFFRADVVGDPTDVEVGLIGLPTDVGLSQRPGARYGPRALREASGMLRYQNVSTGVIPFDFARICDLGDPPLDLWGLEGIVDQITAHYRDLHSAGVVPITAGGDHSVTYPILRAIAADRPVALVHLDSHYDTAPALFGSAVHHGAPVLNAANEGLIDVGRSVQVGMRDPWGELERFSHPPGLRVIAMDEAASLQPAGVAARVREVVGDSPVYISFDIDVIDPTMAPGTGMPVPGGISPYEALTILRGLRRLDVVGADLVEVSPPWDPTGMTALTGAQIMFDLLCLAAEAHAARRR